MGTVTMVDGVDDTTTQCFDAKWLYDTLVKLLYALKDNEISE